MKKIKKGICTYKKGFYGIITVSEKGQIAIPIEARRELDIKTGDKLFVLRKKDNSGLVLIKLKFMNKILEKLRE
jgi:AbrB family looped-hinge helix DNA binding protein